LLLYFYIIFATDNFDRDLYNSIWYRSWYRYVKWITYNNKLHWVVFKPLWIYVHTIYPTFQFWVCSIISIVPTCALCSFRILVSRSVRSCQSSYPIGSGDVPVDHKSPKGKVLASSSTCPCCPLEEASSFRRPLRGRPMQGLTDWPSLVEEMHVPWIAEWRGPQVLPRFGMRSEKLNDSFFLLFSFSSLVEQSLKSTAFDFDRCQAQVTPKNKS